MDVVAEANFAASVMAKLLKAGVLCSREAARCLAKLREAIQNNDIEVMHEYVQKAFYIVYYSA
jgi:flagellin-specific chaperone FliS